MEIKTSNEIIEMMEEADNAEAITDGTHYNVKWVAVDDLINYIENSKSPEGDYPDADCIIKELQKD